MDNQAIAAAASLLQRASDILAQFGNGGEQPNPSTSAPTGGNQTHSSSHALQRSSSSRNNNVPNAPDRSGATTAPVSNVSRVMRASNRFSSTATETRSELSRLFAPYANAESSGRGNRRRMSGARTTIERTWNQKCFFLVTNSITKTPSNASKVAMSRAGYGQEFVQLSLSMESHDVEHAIRDKYPNLARTVNFELMAQAGSGASSTLMRLTTSEAIPPAAVINSAVRRQAVLYIRPDVPIIEEIIVDVESDNSLDVDSELPATSTSAFHTVGSRPGEQNCPTENQNQREQELDPKDTDEVLDEMLTLDDLRRRIYSENPGVQPLLISRDNYAMQVLGVYKHPRFGLLMEPDVTFVGSGEFGADAGALMREYFWTGMTALTSGMYMGNILLFEGDVDLKLPSSDAVLLQNNVFEYVGKFMTHSALHTGVAFVGLNPVVFQYIMQDEPSCCSLAMYLSIKSVPDSEVQEVLELLQEWNGDVEYQPEDVDNINKIAQQCDLTMSITKNTSSFAFDHILYYNIITKRKSQLDALRRGFAKSPVHDFLKSRPYLYDSVFPSTSDVKVPPDVLLRHIKLDGTSELCQTVFSTFLKCLDAVLKNDPSKTSAILKAWTAWPFLPTDKLILKVEGIVLNIRACFNQLILPESSNEASILNAINLIVNEGAVGFGNF